jgi:hypothetical protein
MRDPVLILKRVVRVSATFTFLSVVGCLCGYFAFRVSLDELPVAVAVPIVWIFAISRLLRVALPDSPSSSEQVPPRGRQWIAIMGFLAVVFFSGVAAVDLVLSWATFLYLGLPHLASGAIVGAESLGILCFASFAFAATVMVHREMAQLASAVVAGVWRILRLPSNLADALHYLPKIDQHQH